MKFGPQSPKRPHESPRTHDAATRTADDGRQTLHGQMLQVSRLATVGEMAAGIAHELNQPLAAIANYAHACERLLGKPGVDLVEVQQALHDIAAQAMRAGDILRRLRTMARNRPVQRALGDINTVIREAADLLHSDARASGGRLEFDLAERLPQVLIDAVQIQHVLLNLARNSFEVLSASGSAAPEVRIRSTRAEDGTVEVAVCDNGPGLSASALERLFDPFFSTKEDGTGLGLPISNTVIREHGGTLAYRPNMPAGACFYFRVPVASD